MISDEKYDYRFIDSYAFDIKYLTCKKDGNMYKKYILVVYKDNDKLLVEEIPDDTYLDRFQNIISTYNVEEIISSCDIFDYIYKYKRYYRIENVGIFTKYLYADFVENENDLKPESNDTEEVLALLKKHNI